MRFRPSMSSPAISAILVFMVRHGQLSLLSTTLRTHSPNVVHFFRIRWFRSFVLDVLLLHPHKFLTCVTSKWPTAYTSYALCLNFCSAFFIVRNIETWGNVILLNIFVAALSHWLMEEDKRSKRLRARTAEALRIWDGQNSPSFLSLRSLFSPRIRFLPVFCLLLLSFPCLSLVVGPLDPARSLKKRCNLSPRVRQSPAVKCILMQFIRKTVSQITVCLMVFQNA